MSGNDLCKREIVNKTETNFVYSRNKRTKKTALFNFTTMDGSFVRNLHVLCLTRQGWSNNMTEPSYLCFLGSLFLRYLDSHVSSVSYDTF